MDDIANKLGMSKNDIHLLYNKTKLVEETTFYTLETIFVEIDKIIEASENPIKELYDIKMFVMECLRRKAVSISTSEILSCHIRTIKTKQFEKCTALLKRV